MWHIWVTGGSGIDGWVPRDSLSRIPANGDWRVRGRGCAFRDLWLPDLEQYSSYPGSRNLQLRDFYARHVRRIFPALAVVVVAVLGCRFVVLLPNELVLLGRDVAGGASFVSNLLLWHEAGYFDQTAIYKPLLHLWSLGVKEQFYIVWPLTLWLLHLCLRDRSWVASERWAGRDADTFQHGDRVADLSLHLTAATLRHGTAPQRHPADCDNGGDRRGWACRLAGARLSRSLSTDPAGEHRPAQRRDPQRHFQADAGDGEILFLVKDNRNLMYKLLPPTPGANQNALTPRCWSIVRSDRII